MADVDKELIDHVLEAIEVAKATGKIKKGTNEVTKAIERGNAKLVVVAKDASPPEIVMHLPLLAKEKGIVCVEVPTKEELGASAGIDVPTASVAVVLEGQGKKLVSDIIAKIGVEAKSEEEEKAEEKAEKKEEEKKTKEEKSEKKEEKNPNEEKPEKKEEKKKEEKKSTEEKTS